MKTYIVIGNGCRHFDETEAEEAVLRISYTDKEGNEHHGAHWSKDEVLSATAQMEFDECVTEWDKYVAYNAMYADLCKVLSETDIVKVAHAFYFADEDAPCNKVWRYVQAMRV